MHDLAYLKVLLSTRLVAAINTGSDKLQNIHTVKQYNPGKFPCYLWRSLSKLNVQPPALLGSWTSILNRVENCANQRKQSFIDLLLVYTCHPGLLSIHGKSSDGNK